MPTMPNHQHQMFRHPVVLRTLDVLRVERLTPHMQRVTLGGDELRGFHSVAPDNHVKLFFPNAAGELVTPTLGPNGPEYPPGREPSPMRDYTPRHHDAACNELVVDFVLNGDGPASNWASQAAPGQRIGAGGPRGSFVVASDFDRYMLVGDETALPAIGRWRRCRLACRSRCCWKFPKRGIASRWTRPLTSTSSGSNATARHPASDWSARCGNCRPAPMTRSTGSPPNRTAPARYACSSATNAAFPRNGSAPPAIGRWARTTTNDVIKAGCA